MDKITHLKSINTKLDICFDYGDEEEHKRSVLATLGGAGTAAGTAGAGLYAAGKMAPTGLGGQGLSAMGAARDLGHNVGHLADGGAKQLGSNILQGAKVGKNVAGNALKALLSKIHLSSKLGKLIELNKSIDNIIKFSDQKPENNLRRGLGIGFLGGAGGGALRGALDAKRYEKEGQVYKKRDALGHSVGGYLAGGTVTGAATLPALKFIKNPLAATAAASGAGLVTQQLVQRGLASRTLRKRKAGE